MFDVSIIIPVYNSEKTIKRCLDSVCEQMDCSWQAICVDDGSVDGSVEIIKNYAKEDKRIKLIANKKNLGAACSRNTAINEADGRYIMNLDSDDYLQPNCLGKLLRYADARNVDMCFYKAEFIFMDNVSNRHIPHGIKGEYAELYSGETLFHTLLENNEFFYYCALVLYRKDYLEKYHLRYANLVIGEGGDFIIRALIHADRATVYPKVVYNYCIHTGSVTNAECYKTNLLTGHLVQYVSMLEIIQSKYSEAAEKFLLKQRKMIAGGIAELDYESLATVREHLPNMFTKIIFDSFVAYKASYNISFTKEDVRRLKTFRYVYLYGSGYATTECLCRLSNMGIRVSGIVVSKTPKEKRVLCGYEVFPIEMISTEKMQSIFVICANSIYRNEIVDLLHRQGFSSFIDLEISV